MLVCRTKQCAWAVSLAPFVPSPSPAPFPPAPLVFHPCPPAPCPLSSANIVSLSWQSSVSVVKLRLLGFIFSFEKRFVLPLRICSLTLPLKSSWEDPNLLQHLLCLLLPGKTYRSLPLHGSAYARSPPRCRGRPTASESRTAQTVFRSRFVRNHFDVTELHYSDFSKKEQTFLTLQCPLQICGSLQRHIP